MTTWQPDEKDREFVRVYGEWDPLTPDELQPLMEGFPAPWWMVGGHAIEAFTGVARVHEDIDLVIFGRDVAHLRRQFAGRFHLWSNHGGTFRLIDDDQPEPLDPHSQIWMRPDAQSPWRVDCILNQDVDGRWRSRHDQQHVADLDEVTWVDDRGIRFLAPEIVLLHKAKQGRRKDAVDLENTWPLLRPEQREWLCASVRRLYPEHPWLARLEHA